MMISMLPLKLCRTWSPHCNWSIIKGSGVAMAFIVLDSFAEFRSAAIFRSRTSPSFEASNVGVAGTMKRPTSCASTL